MRLADRLLALDRALGDAGLPHAFGGAFALAYATRHPRATVDIDINVFVPAGDADRVLAALPEGITADDDARAMLRRDGQARVRWEGTPVDLFLSTHVFHDQAARRIRNHQFSGETLPFLHPTDLVVFKAMFDRPKDRVDIATVAAAGTADMDEAVSWIDDLLGADSANAVHLRQALAEASEVDGDGPDRPAGSDG